MLERKAYAEIKEFYQKNEKKALLLTGARQTGKTFLARSLGENFDSFVEINFLENEQALKLFQQTANTKDFLLQLSAIADHPLIPGKTLIFLDEVQECKEIVTRIKFLVEEGSYRYILSGSLLGVELQNIRSVPVGYMDIMEVYPLDFEEFSWACGVSKTVIAELEKSYEEVRPISLIIHEEMMRVFRLYLIVGGMPEVVNTYLQSNNIQRVVETQQMIIRLYKKDIAKYDPDEKLYLEEIFDLIPSELNQKNKRFILKNLNENFKFSRYKNSFLWLKNAGVALPTYCANDLKVPLTLSKSTNLFKLFLSDVGLLAAMYMDGIQVKILKKELDINFGAVYENFAAQELKAHGFPLYYYSNKKNGELDFIIEKDGAVLPIEIKSGKNYVRHNALTNVMKSEEYHLSFAHVYHNENVSVIGNVRYYPIYMLMFLKKNEFDLLGTYQLEIDNLKQMNW